MTKPTLLALCDRSTRETTQSDRSPLFAQGKKAKDLSFILTVKTDQTGQVPK